MKMKFKNSPITAEVSLKKKYCSCKYFLWKKDPAFRQTRWRNSLIHECQRCGMSYLKEDGCFVVKCRCGQKQCSVCGERFESRYSSVHLNERKIDYHLVKCKNK